MIRMKHTYRTLAIAACLAIAPIVASCGSVDEPVSSTPSTTPTTPTVSPKLSANTTTVQSQSLAE